MTGVADRSWFYIHGGQQMGPIEESGLRSLLRDGTLDGSTQVWTEGMDSWQPAADVMPVYSRADRNAEDDSSGVVLFPVSELKFVVMFFATLGLYPVYWSYRNWQYIKGARGLKISPFWRSLFSIFFIFPLMKAIRSEATDRGFPATFSPGSLSLTYLLLLIVGNQLPDPFWVISFLAFLPLLPVVAVVNTLNVGRIEQRSMNSGFSGWNVAGIAVGACMWILLIAGLLLPATG